jgi:hypothetical protein
VAVEAQKASCIFPYQDNQRRDNEDHDKRSPRGISDDYDEDHTAKLSDDRWSAQTLLATVFHGGAVRHQWQ